jgi:hypothetical protein
MDNLKIIGQCQVSSLGSLQIGIWQDTDHQTYVELRHWVDGGSGPETTFRYVCLPIESLSSLVRILKDVTTPMS